MQQQPHPAGWPLQVLLVPEKHEEGEANWTWWVALQRRQRLVGTEGRAARRGASGFILGKAWCRGEVQLPCAAPALLS